MMLKERRVKVQREIKFMDKGIKSIQKIKESENEYLLKRYKQTQKDEYLAKVDENTKLFDQCLKLMENANEKLFDAMAL